MGLLAYGILALAIMGMVGTGVYKVKQWGGNEVRAEWAADSKKQRDREELQISDAVKEFEELRTARKIVYRTTTEVVNREVEKLVYSNICLPDSGLCIANAALLGQSADSCKPDSPVPLPHRPS